MGENDHRGTTIKHYKHWDCVIIPTGDGKCFLIHLPTWTKLYRDRIEYRDFYRGMSRPRVPSDKNKTFTPRKGHGWNDVHYQLFTVEQAERVAEDIACGDPLPAVTLRLSHHDLTQVWPFLSDLLGDLII